MPRHSHQATKSRRRDSWGSASCLRVFVASSECFETNSSQIRLGVAATTFVAALSVCMVLAAAPAVTFSDVTTLAGIRFVHNNGGFGRKYLPETIGSGALFLDVDGD